MKRIRKLRWAFHFAVVMGCGLLVALSGSVSAGIAGDSSSGGSHYLPLVYTRLCNPGSLLPPDNIERDLAVEARINEIRDNNGLPRFTRSEEVAQAALRHSNDMADNNFFSHTGSDGSRAGERLDEACYGWQEYGEIIAAGYKTPASVVEAWMGSAGHRGIILDDTLADFGAGYAYRASSRYKHYWTVTFGLLASEPYRASVSLHECSYHVRDGAGQLWISMYTSQPCDLFAQQ